MVSSFPTNAGIVQWNTRSFLEDQSIQTSYAGKHFKTDK
jgi:hypothetical protein